MITQDAASIRPVRWGMVGCGAVTEVKSGPAFQRAAGSSLVAVASRRVDAARDYAQRHGVPQAFDSVEELIASDAVEAVYIATPPASHLELALQVARAGKSCCVEKPMALNHAECMRMVEAFEAHGLPLFVSYYRRSLPRFAQAKSWLDAGAIGRVRDVQWHLVKPPSPRDTSGATSWRTDPQASPGGYFSDLASHGLDLLQHLLGDIADATGFTVNQQGLYAAEDAVAACWRFSSGALGSGSWNFGGRERRDTVAIVGAAGEIEFSVFDEAPVVLRTGAGEIALHIEHPPNIQLHHVENMVRHLRGGAAHPATGIEAAKTSWVMDRILGIA